MSEDAKHHWRSVAVYVFLVGITAFSVLGYQQHTNQRLDAADRDNCQIRKILEANQRVVLDVLDRNITELVQVPGPAQAQFLKSLRQVHRAQERLVQTPKC